MKCLERVNIDENDKRIIGNLYWNQQAAVRLGTACHLSSPSNVESDKAAFYRLNYSTCIPRVFFGSVKAWEVA